MTKAPRTFATKQRENVEAANDTMTLPDLERNHDLWYKIHVLLYDLCNIANDRAAEARTLSTTDELYISAPYFTPQEAGLIKATVVPRPTLNEIPEFEFEALQDDYDIDTKMEGSAQEQLPESMTVEEAIKSCLHNFFEKRKASGDARPCGPHDMGPIYRAVFGITKDALKDEKFLSRLRRVGLRVEHSSTRVENGSSKQKKKGGRKD